MCFKITVRERSGHSHVRYGIHGSRRCDGAKLIIADVNPGGGRCQVSWIYLLKTFNWNIYLSEGRKGTWSKIYASPLRAKRFGVIMAGANACKTNLGIEGIWRRGESYVYTYDWLYLQQVFSFVRDASWVLSRQRNFAKSLAAAPCSDVVLNKLVRIGARHCGQRTKQGWHEMFTLNDDINRKIAERSPGKLGYSTGFQFVLFLSINTRSACMRRQLRFQTKKCHVGLEEWLLTTWPVWDWVQLNIYRNSPHGLLCLFGRSPGDRRSILIQKYFSFIFLTKKTAGWICVIHIFFPDREKAFLRKINKAIRRPVVA